MCFDLQGLQKDFVFLCNRNDGDSVTVVFVGKTASLEHHLWYAAVTDHWILVDSMSGDGACKKLF